MKLTISLTLDAAGINIDAVTIDGVAVDPAAVSDLRAKLAGIAAAGAALRRGFDTVTGRASTDAPNPAPARETVGEAIGAGLAGLAEKAVEAIGHNTGRRRGGL